MSKRVDKLLNITIGDLREKLAYADADDLVKDWLYNEADFEEIEEDFDDCDEVDDEIYEDDEDTDEAGSLSLPSEEEERLAMDIADDIDAGKYSLDNIRGIYPSEVITRIEYLID